MSDITLTNAVRANLNTLTSTAKMMSDVQNKLATGKKVNSALDNPNSFFTAKGLENRASDLSTLLDDMGQGVQTLKAADKGISAISDLVDAAKAKANQALQTSDKVQRSKYAQEYNDLLSQMEDLAKDSGYKGKNLLSGTGNDLSLTFNEDGSSSLSISAVDYTNSSAGLGLSDIDRTATSATAQLEFAADGTSTTAHVVDQGTYKAGDTLTVTDSKGDSVGTVSITDTMSMADLATALNGLTGVTSTYDNTTGNISFAGEGIQLKNGSEEIGTGGTISDFDTDSKIETALSALKSAQDTLRAQASTFGTNLSIVENRQDFTTDLINTLQEGAGALTLADTNVEGANLLALQTQQQLASTSLSMASQASQNVLRLF
ncbi:flagellin [Roseibium alexandrii]|uniref:Flagellin n=1 Tax=Roseibium alexandrii (strain DSM 17067 / NCIMB 14079 / DFL-11) TaxID=244592 RepID=A0A5E8H4C6_ROSAD|nr:flagellin [Roseibium alexandrii]EEE47526.2 Flagellin/related hook-associated protein [Roseibium alexandrii DFL-11]